MTATHEILRKEVLPINFLYHRVEVKVSELIHQVPVAKELFKEAVRLDLHPSGPIHWHYTGFTGDESLAFTLDICLPVASVPNDYDGRFHFKRTDNFKSVSILHEGPWNDIPVSYGELIRFMQEHQLQPAGVTRELYINADFINPASNVTEIQMGIN
jgi:effector-binding domain-containing protein